MEGHIPWGVCSHEVVAARYGIQSLAGLNVWLLAGARFGGMMGFMPGMPGIPGAMPGMQGAMNPLGLSGMRAGEKDPGWGWAS